MQEKIRMFSLFYGLWKYMMRKVEFHVLILGIDKAGKTTLLEKVKSQHSNVEGLPPDKIVPTVGLNIGRVEVSNTKLVFWDLGGQAGLRSIWEKYYDEAHAVIYVIDATCPSRFEDSKSALEKVLRNEGLRGAPLLILAKMQNKAQLVVIAHDVDPIELVVWLPALCRKMEIPYCIVKGKARLGTIVHKKTASVLCLTFVKNEDKLEFSRILEAIKANFNDKFDETRKWGGGVMGSNSQAKTKPKERVLAKEAAQRMT